jgi:hypothetical protein
MEKRAKYIYSAYGKEFEEIMTLLREQGINTKIDELALLAYDLVKNNNVDRTQLEMYICNNFRFKLLKNVLDDPMAVEKLNNVEEKEDGK